MNKGIENDTHEVMLEGLFKGEEHSEDSAYYFDKYVEEEFKISLYSFLDENDVFDEERFRRTVDHRNDYLWSWSKSSMSWKLR